MSRVTHVIFLLIISSSSYKVVKLVGGGSVINRATPSSFKEGSSLSSNYKIFLAVTDNTNLRCFKVCVPGY